MCIGLSDVPKYLWYLLWSGRTMHFIWQTNHRKSFSGFAGNKDVRLSDLLNLKCVFLIFLVPVEGLKNQKFFDELRSTYIKELSQLINCRLTTNCSLRFYQLTRVLDSIQLVRNISTLFFYLHICSSFMHFFLQLTIIVCNSTKHGKIISLTVLLPKQVMAMKAKQLVSSQDQIERKQGRGLWRWDSAWCDMKRNWVGITFNKQCRKKHIWTYVTCLWFCSCFRR